MTPLSVKGLAPVYSLADNLRRERERQLAEAEAQRRRELHAKLGDELLLRFGYVPFIIAATAWDFADSVRDLCAIVRAGGREVRRCSESVRLLRLEYERWLISRRFSAFQRKEQENNMIDLQAELKDDFNALHAFIRDKQPAGAHPDLTLLRCAAVECRCVIDVFLVYTANIADRVRERTGVDPGPVMPDMLDRLDRAMELMARLLGAVLPTTEERAPLAERIALRLLNAQLTLRQADGRAVEHILLKDAPAQGVLTFDFTLDKPVVKTVPRTPENCAERAQAPSEPKGGGTAQSAPETPREAVQTRVCPVCGTQFAPRSWNHRYCSAPCAARHKAEARKRKS